MCGHCLSRDLRPPAASPGVKGSLGSLDPRLSRLCRAGLSQGPGPSSMVSEDRPRVLPCSRIEEVALLTFPRGPGDLGPRKLGPSPAQDCPSRSVQLAALLLLQLNALDFHLQPGYHGHHPSLCFLGFWTIRKSLPCSRGPPYPLFPRDPASQSLRKANTEGGAAPARVAGACERC